MLWRVNRERRAFIIESRYLVAGNTLLIASVGARDAGAYSCLARHALSGATKRARSATLTVTGQYLPPPTHCTTRC